MNQNTISKIDKLYKKSFVILIPFYHNSSRTIEAVKSVIREIKTFGTVLLINDGSNKSQLQSVEKFTKLLRNVKIISHNKNRGVANARNTGISWCRKKNIEIIIMIDSDTVLKKNCIYNHLNIHQNYKSISIVGGAIIGKSSGFLGKIDGIVSWVHSIPYKNWHFVKKPYHLPTNNLSLKLKYFKDLNLFPGFLKTGEDAYFIKKAQENKKQIFFSPSPQIIHKDREDFISVIKHHFEWGHHQYFLLNRFKNFYYCFNIIYRIFFFLFFLFVFPFYTLIGSFLNISPWLRFKPKYIIYFPFVFALWLLKSAAIFHATINPSKCIIND